MCIICKIAFLAEQIKMTKISMDEKLSFSIEITEPVEQFIFYQLLILEVDSMSCLFYELINCIMAAVLLIVLWLPTPTSCSPA